MVLVARHQLRKLYFIVENLLVDTWGKSSVASLCETPESLMFYGFMENTSFEMLQKTYL